MTQLELHRKHFSDQCTIGELYLDGKFECFVLEDVVRPTKIAGETAIPAGRYEVRLTHSERFNRTMPILCEVPGFTGIRIHEGNTKADTRGCLLVGESVGKDIIYKSREAYALLYAKLEKAPGPMFITIKELR